MDRKDFIKRSALVCGAIMVGGALIESCKKNNPAPAPVNFSINLTDPTYAALKTVGGFIENSNAIVIRTGASTYVALSDICTHAGCTVSYYNSQNQIVCPCHGGAYDINGNVIAGPPPSALAKYNVSVSGNTLTVSS